MTAGIAFKLVGLVLVACAAVSPLAYAASAGRWDVVAQYGLLSGVFVGFLVWVCRRESAE